MKRVHRPRQFETNKSNYTMIGFELVRKNNTPTMNSDSVKETIMYKWFCKSNDGAYEEESKYNFETKKEAYNNMRNAALEKMKWNTEYDEDFDDEDDEIDYHVDFSFSKGMIVHESYSGVYTYVIKEI